jgi:hypothetical protein
VIRDWYGAHRRLVVVAAVIAAIGLSVVYILAPVLAAGIGILGVWIGAVVLALWDRWDRVEKWGGRAIGALSYLSTRAERVGLSAEMQGLINGARRELEDELPDVMPYAARVQFVRNEADLAVLGEGEVVISLKDPRRRAENTARATMAYVSAATLRPARPYVARDVVTGVDYSLTKKILREADVRALDYFLTEMWEPGLRAQPDLRDICHEVERIEGQGLLTRILLSEFLQLGRELWGQFPPRDVLSETREFVAYLARVGDKHPDDLPDLDFIRRHIKVGIVLVGERERAEQEGARPYVQATLYRMGRGAQSVYLLARGARRPLVSEVLSQVENDGRVLAVDVTEYTVTIDDHPVGAVCARLTVDQQRGRRPRRQ